MRDKPIILNRLNENKISVTLGNNQQNQRGKNLMQPIDDIQTCLITISTCLLTISTKKKSPKM